MHKLITRSISGFVYVSLFIFAIVFGARSYIILTSIFAIICIWEFSKLIKLKSIIPYILLPLSVYYFTNYTLGNENVILVILTITLLCSVRLIFYLYSTNIYIIPLIGKLYLSLFYIILPFNFLILIPFITGEYKYNIVICILIFTWVNDSFAYLIGKNFGKYKLFKAISPKKTIEGFIGGWIFSLIAALIIKEYNYTYLSLIDMMIIASILSIFGAVGDLIESKFKRQANIKDSGNIMPGHGGLLDRLDSLYFSAPFVYLYLLCCTI